MTKAIQFPVGLKQRMHINAYKLNLYNSVRSILIINASCFLLILIGAASLASEDLSDDQSLQARYFKNSISSQERVYRTRDAGMGFNSRERAQEGARLRVNESCYFSTGLPSMHPIAYGEVTNVSCRIGSTGSHVCDVTMRCFTREQVQANIARRRAELASRERAEAASRQRAQEEQRRQQAAAAAQQRAAQERRAREAQERQREEEERLRQEEEARLLAEAERAQREEDDRLRREAEEAERARREELAQAGLEAVNRCNPPLRGNARWLGLGVSAEPGMYQSFHYPRGGDFSRPENYVCSVMSPLAACEGLMCSEAVRIRMDHMVRREVGESAFRNQGTCHEVATRRVSAEMRYSPVPSRANIEQDGFMEPSSLLGPLRAARDAEWNARVNHVARMFRSAHQENVTRVAQCLESAGFNFQGQSLQEFDMWGDSVDTIRGGEEGGARPGDPG